ncbi:MAG: DUF4105 domain-containing protein [Polyangiaceae bacterium]|nr:DUF4105 domain-containing protein [Polyangiaceae bacterium]
MRPLRALALVAPLALVALSPAVARAEPGDELTVSVLTFGPGDHPFFKFGHNAILVHDERRRVDRVYNYGTFAFESWTLIPNFLKGKLKYWLSEQSLRGTLALYRRENRTVDEQVLDLTPEQRLEIAGALAKQEADPVARYYKYDYYEDNCSTRVRDAVDAVTRGRLRAASTGPASMTWRDHTRRLTADDTLVGFGLDLAMGDFIDKKTTVWEEMFLPAKLEETLRKATIVRPDGTSAPLVKLERRLQTAPGRADPLSAPPSRTLPMLAIGAAAGGLLAGLGKGARASRGARALLGGTSALLGLVLGVLGSIFVMFWVATDHRVAYANENLFVCAPLALWLVGLGVKVARGRPGSDERFAKVTAALAAVAVVGVLVKALPFCDQSNARALALLVPVWLGMAAGAALLLGRSPLAPPKPVDGSAEAAKVPAPNQGA